MRPCDAARSKCLAGEGAFALRREEDGDARYQQGLREAFDDGVEQGSQVGLRVQSAAEFDQGLAVVEALLIEDAVYARLNGSLQRIEDEAGDDDCSEDVPTCAGPGQAGRDDHLCGYCDDAEVEPDERCRGERVGDAALEDEIDVHQAVADDRPTEGQRDEDQRKAGELSHQRPGRHASDR